MCTLVQEMSELVVWTSRPSQSVGQVDNEIQFVHSDQAQERRCPGCWGGAGMSPVSEEQMW